MASTKSVLLVLPSHNFDEREYESVREALEKLGFEVKVASTVKERATGVAGAEVDPDLLIDEADPDRFAAVIFIGGPGACQYWHDAVAQELCRRAVQNGQLLAALSYAPVALATSGVLNGRRATGHPSIYEKVMTEKASFTGEAVEAEDKVITGEGGRHVPKFLQALTEALDRNT